MAVIEAVPLIETAVPVPQVLKHLYIYMAVVIIAGVVVFIKPCSKRAVGMILALGAVGVQRNDGEVGFLEVAFCKSHQAEHPLPAHYDPVCL